MVETESREPDRPRTGHARLGEFCRRLTGAPDSLDLGPAGRRLVEHLTSQLRAGRPPAELDDAFDELEELLLMAGHTAGLGSYRTAPTTGPTYRALPVAGPGHPPLHVLACPHGHCGRVEVPDAAHASQCLVFGQPLRAVGLR
ncbi:hypothetical protein [Kitasatospora sp. NPDC058218]|uniref:hypothetical protein n=1 Tax=Kitasatospora sp. NPDC058218 TaxID=3346385 RepID=UPI0036DF1447